MVYKPLVVVSLALSALSLAACVQAPPARATGPVVPVFAGAPGGAQVPMSPLSATVLRSPSEPPEAKSETTGTAPLAGQVWVQGYWYWQAHQYVWIPGHWETPPQPGLRWVPHQWVPDQGGWRLVGGRWER